MLRGSAMHCSEAKRKVFIECTHNVLRLLVSLSALLVVLPAASLKFYLSQRFTDLKYSFHITRIHQPQCPKLKRISYPHQKGPNLTQCTPISVHTPMADTKRRPCWKIPTWGVPLESETRQPPSLLSNIQTCPRTQMVR